MIVIINAYFIQSVKLLLDEAKEMHSTAESATEDLIGIELQPPLMDFKNTIIKRKLA